MQLQLRKVQVIRGREQKKEKEEEQNKQVNLINIESQLWFLLTFSASMDVIGR